MTGPLISVVVPLYKAEDYIEKCLRSIMSQTLRRIEILCVDDCSPDGSAGVVERLARQDDRITLIRHETNRGPGAARNSAIRAARADFLASVDSDDHVDPDFLERLWDGSEDGYFDVTICGYCRVRPDGTVIDRHLHDKRLILDPLPADQNPIRISGPEVWNKLWRRSLFVDNDIWFPDHIYHQDSATTPLIYMKARNVRFIGGSPYHYLIREGSITQTTSDKHLLDRFRCMDVLKEFILREGSYERLKEAIEDRIYSGYSYHVGHVVKNRLGGDAATDTYLRHLLIMREAYLEHDMTVRAMSLEEKADHLIRHRPLPRRGAVAAAAAGPAPAGDRPPLPESPKVLVLTLHRGEHEFEAACAALAAQTHPDWQHRVIRGRGAQEARAALRQCISDSTAGFDLVLRMEADTAFARKDALAEIIRIFRERPALDHLALGCEDFLTGEQAPGVEVFRSRMPGEDGGEDEGGAGAGGGGDPPDSGALPGLPQEPLFLRNADPSAFQAFHAGACRALDLTGAGQVSGPARAGTDEARWRALEGIRTQFTRHGDRRHALALVAADLVLGGGLGETARDPCDPALQAAFGMHALHPGLDLAERVARNRATTPARRACREGATGRIGPEAGPETGPETATPA